MWDGDSNGSSIVDMGAYEFGAPYLCQPFMKDFIWATKAGGTDAEVAYSIAVDNKGNSYITGAFRGTAVFGTINLTAAGSSGSYDIFIAKYDKFGRLKWAKQAGGPNVYDFGYGIAVDDSGNS